LVRVQVWCVDSLVHSFCRPTSGWISCFFRALYCDMPTVVSEVAPVLRIPDAVEPPRPEFASWRRLLLPLMNRDFAHRPSRQRKAATRIRAKSPPDRFGIILGLFAAAAAAWGQPGSLDPSFVPQT